MAGSSSPSLDCLVVGAGPAGLTAAIYLARFRLRVEIIDAGKSRAAMITCTHNHPGYPGGIAGKDLLARMREQAEGFGVRVREDFVEALNIEDGGFSACLDGETLSARKVLLATGVVNTRPRIAPEIHDVALERGLLRYCPICDGYEVTDKRIAVIGSSTHGANEAIFLRAYSADVTLIAPDGGHALDDRDRARLAQAQVVLRDGPCALLSIIEDRIHLLVPQRRSPSIRSIRL